MAGKFEIYKDKAGEYRFRLKANNGQIILTGESYKAKDGVLNGIESIKTNAGDHAKFEVKRAKNGNHYFVLKAANHQIVGKSALHASLQDCRGAIQSASATAADATIVEQQETYHVVADLQDKWSVRRVGAERAIATYESKDKAIAHAERLGQAHRARVIVHQKDGRVSNG